MLSRWLHECVGYNCIASTCDDHLKKTPTLLLNTLIIARQKPMPELLANTKRQINKRSANHARARQNPMRQLRVRPGFDLARNRNYTCEITFLPSPQGATANNQSHWTC